MTAFIKPSSENVGSSAPYIIGVAGGSGSGKTYFVTALQKHLQAKFGSEACSVIFQDSFYIDQSGSFDFDGGSVNFDHPDSIDFKLLAARIRILKSGRATEIPIYDFKTHSRRENSNTVQPAPIILVDGILIFHKDEVRSLFDELIFFDTREELRFERRLHRDVHERGRTPEGVKNQFLNQVKPMHDTFVEPSKRFADLTVCEVEEFDGVFKTYCDKLGAKLVQRMAQRTTS